MKKTILFFISVLLFFAQELSAQEIFIGKDYIRDWNAPISTSGNGVYQYNQLIYKQEWIHSQGNITKIAFYFSGTAQLVNDIVVYMGHTTKQLFNLFEWIPLADLTKVFIGTYTLPAAEGWVEITLQTPFDYDNIHNLVIAIDNNSKLSGNGFFISSKVDDNRGSMRCTDANYNIDPSLPQGDFQIMNYIPNIKITGNFTESTYLYLYGQANFNISTTPGSTVNIAIETNLSDYTFSDDLDWLDYTVDKVSKTLSAKVISSSSRLDDNKRSADANIYINGLIKDSVVFNQYKFESIQITGKTAMSFIDYDSDGDLDLTGSYPDIGVNNGLGEFTFQALNMLENTNGRSYWCDYDNDGDFDFLVIGYRWDSTECYTKIFRNDGNNSYNDIQAELKLFYLDGLVGTSAFWFDYNNDGLQDLLISGVDSYSYNSVNTILYKNVGGDKFVDSGIKLKKVGRGTVDCGDYNGDGLIDVVISGQDNNGNSVVVVYKNEGAGAFSEIETGILGLMNSTAFWGDYDNDGDLDLLTSGRNNNSLHYNRIYRNDGDDIFKTVELNLTGLNNTSTNWLDYNNDGAIDIVQFGSDPEGYKMIRYKNMGNSTFSEDFVMPINDAQPNGSGYLSPGDFDNDGDLEILRYQQYAFDSQIFRNNSDISNTKPSVPSGLKTFRKGNRIYLTWDRAADGETSSESLSYNVRVGTAPGMFDIVSPNANINTGFIRIPIMGNCSLDTFKVLENLPVGEYYYSVQSIDNVYSSSQFSTESNFSVQPPFSELNIGIPKLFGCASAWGDYDNDGDLDLVLIGRISSYTGEIVRIYKNTGDSTFIEIDPGIPGMFNGSVVWGDYDNDDDLDILISGTTGSECSKAMVLKNNGNDSFTSLQLPAFCTYNSSAIWGDFDNDGDLDIGINSAFYRNDGNDIFTSIPGSSINEQFPINSFADYNNDMRNEFFVSSKEKHPSLLTYQNGSIAQSHTGLMNLHWGSMDWGDYDNDGDLDLLFTGRDSLFYNYTLIYQNLGMGSFKKINNFDVRSISSGHAHWGDFDNDGDLDIVLAGVSMDKIVKVYGNKGGNIFEEIMDRPVNFFEPANFADWGDYNNDGNLDFLMNGILFSNNYNTNSRSSYPPIDLRMTPDGFDAILTWNDQKNSNNLTYNIRMGTTPGGTDIISPMSDRVTGYRRIPEIGNAQCNKSWRINNLTAGKEYYWSVQSISNSFTGGTWAPEHSFIVQNVYANFEADTVCNGFPTSFTDLSSSPTQTISYWEWDFGDGGSSLVQNPKYYYTEPGEYNVKLIVKQDNLSFSQTKKVIVKPTPDADFTFENKFQAREVISFTNTSNTDNLNINKWLWDFGDGYTFTGKDPSPHGYIEEGLKKITLIIEADNGCSDTVRKEITICNETLDKPMIIVKGPSVWYMTCSNSTANLYRWYYNNELITGANTYFYLANNRMGTYRVEISNKGTCYIPSDDITIPPGITGTEDPDPFIDIRIYPNPNTGLFTIEMNNNIFGELIIDIFKQNGSKALNIKIEKTTENFLSQIDLSGQPKGIYLIHISLDEYRAVRKVVVE